ncbi:hypothetical protein CesoFtcFv8_017027 [Champsocephalus esox]|uniref:Uncharacterized protein n=1 Tax=Champsocephalus esox TaxID=159716 RepID=A0AAN8BJ23_9TELE|nr:hypothetical protein CesoFtcFv8_017027 [Champsocephalus esox]
MRGRGGRGVGDGEKRESAGESEGARGGGTSGERRCRAGEAGAGTRERGVDAMWVRGREAGEGDGWRAAPIEGARERASESVCREREMGCEACEPRVWGGEGGVRERRERGWRERWESARAGTGRGQGGRGARARGAVCGECDGAVGALSQAATAREESRRGWGARAAGRR